MNEQKKTKKDKLVWVKDKDGNKFVCPLRALKDPEKLTEEEKSRCTDYEAPRGLISPL